MAVKTDVLLLAESGDVTVARRTAFYTYGKFDVVLPEGQEQEETDSRLTDGYLARAHDGNVGRFDFGFIRADATVNIDAGTSDLETQIDSAELRSEGDVFFEGDIGPEGFNGFAPGVDFDTGDIVSVARWGSRLSLPVTDIEYEVSDSGGPRASRVHVSGQLIHDAASRRRSNDEIRQQIAAEKRERLRQVGAVDQKATQAKDAADDAVRAVNDADGVIQGHVKSAREYSEESFEHSQQSYVHSETSREHSASSLLHSESSLQHSQDSWGHSEVAKGHAADAWQHSEDSQQHSAESLSHSQTAHGYSQTAFGHSDSARVYSEAAQASSEAAAQASQQVQQLQPTIQALAESAQTASAESSQHSQDAQAASAESSQHSQAATNAADLSVDSLRQAELARDTAEQHRNQAESSRDEAETARRRGFAAMTASHASMAMAEQARASAENERAAAESARALAESDRQAAEQARDRAETARSAAEGERALAENSRKRGFAAMNASHASMAMAEQARASAEADRAAAEEARALAEGERQAAETEREKAETAREGAENARNATVAANSKAIAILRYEAMRFASRMSVEIDPNGNNKPAGIGNLEKYGTPISNEFISISRASQVRTTTLQIADVGVRTFHFWDFHIQLSGSWSGIITWEADTGAVEDSTFRSETMIVIGGEFAGARAWLDDPANANSGFRPSVENRLKRTPALTTGGIVNVKVYPEYIEGETNLAPYMP